MKKNNFIAATIGLADFQRKNLFRVEMGTWNNAVEYYVLSATTPQETTSQLKFDWMASDYKLAGKTNYNDWTVTVRDSQGKGVDNSDGSTVPGGFIYQFFNIWRNYVYNRDGLVQLLPGGGEKIHNEAGMGVTGRPTQYKRDIVLELLNSAGGIAKKFELKGAWPMSIGSATLDYSGEGLLAFPVTFSYDWFKSIG